MSDESQSRDWQLAEPAPGCSGDTSSTNDGRQFASERTSESDVRQFSNLSSVATGSSVNDISNKSDRSDVTESSQLHNQCMLSGIDESSVNSESNVSVRSADVSADAELNDARLSDTNVDSSLNSTLKASDADELCSKHCGTEVDTLQTTFSVSIPISNVLEMETKTGEIADVHNTDIKSSGGQCINEPVQAAYSPISDASEEPPGCQTPVPSAPALRDFSPVSPFTPGPSASSIPQPIMPLYCSRSMSASACDASVWNTAASLPESVDITNARPHLCDVTVPATAVSAATNFTFMHQSSYSSHFRRSRGRPMDTNVPAGHFQNISFEHQHTDVMSHHAYQQPQKQYSGPTLPHLWHQSHSQQPYMHCANTVGGSMSTHSLYSVNSQKQDIARLSSVKSEDYRVTRCATSVCDSNVESSGFMVSSDQDVWSTHEVHSVGHLPSVATRAGVDNKFDKWQMHCHDAAANTRISNNG